MPIAPGRLRFNESRTLCAFRTARVSQEDKAGGKRWRCFWPMSAEPMRVWRLPGTGSSMHPASRAIAARITTAFDRVVKTYLTEQDNPTPVGGLRGRGRPGLGRQGGTDQSRLGFLGRPAGAADRCRSCPPDQRPDRTGLCDTASGGRGCLDAAHAPAASRPQRASRWSSVPALAFNVCAVAACPAAASPRMECRGRPYQPALEHRREYLQTASAPSA